MMRPFILTVPALLAVRGSDLPIRMSDNMGNNDAVINTTSTTSSIEVRDMKPSVESQGTRMDTPGIVSCSDAEIGDCKFDDSGIYSEEGLQATSEYAAIRIEAGDTMTAAGGEYPHAFKNKESVMTYDCNEGEVWEGPLLSGGNLWATNDSTRDEADRIILENDGEVVVEEVVVEEVVIEEVVIEEVVVVEKVVVVEEVVGMDVPCTKTVGCLENMNEP